MKLPTTIYSKLISIAIGPILLIALAAGLTVYTVFTSISSMALLFEKNYYLEELLTEVAAAENNLSTYISSRNTESLRQYYSHSRILGEMIPDLDTVVYTTEGVLIERDLARLVAGFLLTGEAAVQAKRGRNTLEYTKQHYRIQEMGNQIRERAATLRLFMLDNQLSSLTIFSRRMRRAIVLNLATIGAALLFGVFVVLYFTQRISAPISLLGSEARKIAQGIFDGTVLAAEGDDEISASARAFNLMKKSIQDSFNQIHAKAEIERALLQERLKNMEMTGLLRKAELDALQAKINPHFLFNTLNTGLQLAVVEGAERTRIFLEQLAALMRYSFRESDNSLATLKEELHHLESYLYLITIRFPGVFVFDISACQDTENALVPKMTIQPLAENAIRHGLQQKSQDARLTLQGRLDTDNLLIIMEDNGLGISQDRIREIFEAADQNKDLADQTTGGHGLSNVIRRLRHFSGRINVFSIEPLDPCGTRITINIPFKEVS
ncbi:MAG: histidine kinase [Spirochaetaceae bacterium]|jgi:sensor histidine kinase YesM|nr:histidine kinase [Spirochaetaceae bacterium]